MRLTKKKAIELCLELWTWLAETGRYKYDWPGWVKYGREIVADCWFCEYDVRQRKSKGGEGCQYCLLQQIGMSHCSVSHYHDWSGATNEKDRKKYADLFLEQIKEIK